MSWIDEIKTAVFSKKTDSSKHEIPEGVWTKCENCNQVLYRSELERNLNVCPKCGHHMRIKARVRLENFLDPNSYEEIGEALAPQDILRFKDLKRYKERFAAAQKTTGEKDAIVVEKGTLMGIPVVACAFEFNFMAGSMGSVVGARFCLGVHECLNSHRALVCFASSGGARMQESLVSLMQMAKTSAALSKLANAHLPFVSVMVNPTMGGVTASLAMLGDINIAEPHALIGFAGPRVIEQTVREKLPEGFQQSEFLLDKGAIDMIVPRHNMRSEIAELLAKMLGYQLNGNVFILPPALENKSESTDQFELSDLDEPNEFAEISNNFNNDSSIVSISDDSAITKRRRTGNKSKSISEDAESNKESTITVKGKGSSSSAKDNTINDADTDDKGSEEGTKKSTKRATSKRRGPKE